MTASQRPFIVAVLLLSVLGAGLRFRHWDKPYAQPDEAITEGVVTWMQWTGALDTNWHKPSVPPMFRYGEYNFSSYMYAAYWFSEAVEILPTSWTAWRNGASFRRLFSVLCGTLVIGLTAWVGYRFGGRLTAIIATLLVSLNPQLIQDAHYSRPESFVTALMLVVAGSSLGTKAAAFERVLVAFTMGILIACKFSFVSIAWLPFVPLALSYRRSQERKPLLVVASVSAVALVAGVLVGVPGIVTYPQDYWKGVQALRTQYAGGHPPHSLMSGAPVLFRMGAYYLATTGITTAALFATGALTSVLERRWTVLVALVVPVGLSVIVFGSQHVFFERNLSHVVPLYLLIAAAGLVAVAGLVRRSWPRAAPVATLTALGLLAHMVWVPASLSARLLDCFSMGPSQVDEAFERQVRAEHRAAGFMATDLFSPSRIDEVGLQLGAASPLLLRVNDFGDDYTARHLDELRRRFVTQPLVERLTMFPEVPTSTLQTYLSSTRRYFMVTGERR